MPTPTNLKWREARKLVDATVLEIIERRRAAVAAGTADEHEDFLKYMITSKDEKTGRGLSPEAIHDNVLTMLFAGYDTTSVTLT